MKAYSPQLAKLCLGPFDSEDYIYERKLDGMRCIAYVDGKDITLINRVGNDITDRFPEIKIKSNAPAVYDGELVCFHNNRTDFQRIQTRMNREYAIADQAVMYPATFIAFDIIEVDHSSVATQPLIIRKQLLAKNFVCTITSKIISYTRGDGKEQFAIAQAEGYEGIMAKRIDSTYAFGRRTADWLKIKVRQSITATILGVTIGHGKRRNTFGSLLLGIPTNNGFTFVGEVGTGFTDSELLDLLEILKALATTKSHCDSVKDVAFWVKPVIECRVEYLELSNAGMLRHPSFVELNLDNEKILNAMEVK